MARDRKKPLATVGAAGRWSPAGPSSIEAPITSPWPPAAAALGATSVVVMVGEVCAFLEQQAAPLAVERACEGSSGQRSQWRA